MSTHTLAAPITDLVLVEVAPAWSREKVLLTGGVSLTPGVVLAKVADKYQPINFAGTGDAKKAAAIAYEPVDVGAGDRLGIVLARGAVVECAGLIWPAATTDAQKATATADLESRGIVCRLAL